MDPPRGGRALSPVLRNGRRAPGDPPGGVLPERNYLFLRRGAGKRGGPAAGALPGGPPGPPAPGGGDGGGFLRPGDFPGAVL